MGKKNYCLIFLIILWLLGSILPNNKYVQASEDHSWEDDFSDGEYCEWNVTRGAFAAGLLVANTSSFNWIHHESTNAYGEWEWRVQYGGAAAAHIAFIGTNHLADDYYITDNGYSVRLNIEGIYLTKLLTGLSEIDMDHYAFTPGANTWYKIKVIRYVNDTFKVFLNDVQRLTATDSTYTTSESLQLPWYNTSKLDYVKVTGAANWEEEFEKDSLNDWNNTRGQFYIETGFLEGVSTEFNWACHESTVAFGEWEWQVYYSGIDAAHVAFIGLDAQVENNYLCDNGYSIRLNPTGLYLTKLVDGENEEDLANYSFTPEAKQAYKIKVTRNSENCSFNVYLDEELKLQASDSSYYNSSYLQLPWYGQHKLDWIKVTEENLPEITPTPTPTPTITPQVPTITLANTGILIIITAGILGAYWKKKQNTH